MSRSRANLLRIDRIVVVASRLADAPFAMLGIPMRFAVFRPAFGKSALVDSPEFWFAMPLAMLGGVVTAYPVNWWLIRAGLKEKM